MPLKSSKYLLPVLCLVLFGALLLAYSNHFQNGFHFDDSHAVEDNPMIRDIRNLPLFFTDARTFSVHPFNQAYRPVVTASLAIDYWLGGSLAPFYFHLTTFLWFVAELCCMFVLYAAVLQRASAHPRNFLVALFGVAWYGLHPVSAETVNYIIQRGDLYSTLGVVAGFAAFVSSSVLRKTGLYLVPVVLGAFSKPLSIMFAPLLGLYLLYFEEDAGLRVWERSYNWRGFVRAVVRSLPALAVCLACYLIQDRMTPPTSTPGGASLVRYIQTQPYVYLHYCLCLFLPLWLTADSDMMPFATPTDPRALGGYLFVLALLLVAIFTSRERRLRPISFGILWFLIALIPTTVIPLAEVENDHRMFFPFVGLILSICWAVTLLVRSIAASAVRRGAAAVLVAAFVLALPVYGYATYLRNFVWRTEETLWRDVTVKSPRNGRGLMNYGLTLMAKGDFTEALSYFQKAKAFTPNYYTLEINLGVCLAAMGRRNEAEPHFKRAIQLSPNLGAPYFYYARWLHQQNRNFEAAQNLQVAVARVPFDFESRHLLMKVYLESREWASLRAAIDDAAAIAPGDPEISSYRAQLEQLSQKEISDALKAARETPTPEGWLQLSFVHYRAGQYEQCIDAAREAIKLKSDYAEAYNNIGSAYAALGRWDQAIEAENAALAINPNFQLAKNNLLWATEQRGNASAPQR